MFSYWEQQTFLSTFDIAIIGSGIVGLNAAIDLRQRYPQARIAVLERGILPTGASTKNAGFACFGSVSELLADLETQSADEVYNLVLRRYKGLLALRQRLGEQDIEFYQHGNYEIFTPKDSLLYQKCVEKIPELNQILKEVLGVDNVFQPKNELIAALGLSQVENLIWNSAEGQLHTGKMMRKLLFTAQSMGIQVLNSVEIESLESEPDRVILKTKNFSTLSARKVLVATNGFARQLLPHLAVQPARNQVLVTAPVPNLKLQGCFHQDEGYIYFRNIDGRVLIGGGRNTALETESTAEFGLTAHIQNYLENILFTHILPNQKVSIEYRWAGILGLGEGKKPIIENVTDNVIAAVRMGGMGVAIGILVAQDAVNLIEL